jgi:predicted HTH domain antitoxin
VGKMSVTTIRLSEELLKAVEKRVKLEHIDKTTALREFIFEGVKEWKKEEAVKMFKSGKSLSEAAKFAGLSIREIMELLVQEGVKSDLTPEEFKESLLDAYKVFGVVQQEKLG